MLSVCQNAIDIGKSYDLLLIALGYETRSSHLLRLGMNARKIVAIPFDTNREGAFESNRRIAESRQAEFAAPTTESISATVTDAVAAAVDGVGVGRECNISVDISSFTRSRLARIVNALHSSSQSSGRELVVDFFYSPAEFVPPTEGSQARLSMSPIGAGFAGTLRRSDLPLAVIFGLGYEPQQALGAYEMLEPSSTWAFFPQGIDDRYSELVTHANGHILQIAENARVVPYSLDVPASLYQSLESLVFSLSSESRVLLLPMGPKIFGLACLLVAIGEGSWRPAVWRVGQAEHVDIRDAIEQGPVTSLTARFIPGV
jgi:hypothetical protein